MGYDELAEIFSPFAAAYLLKKARQLVVSLRLPADELDDVKQDLFLFVWKRWQKYDPERGERNTFFRLLADRGFAFLRKKKLAHKRGKHLAHVTLSSERNVPKHHKFLRDHVTSIDLSGAAPSENYQYDTDCSRKMDMETFLGTLPPRLRDMCVGLMYFNAKDMAEVLGEHRTTYYRYRDEIREAMIDAGLDQYCDF